jgi:hypothetical protein
LAGDGSVTLNVAVDRAEARLLPSRHRFALARLIAYLRLLRRPPAGAQPEHLILAIDRDQTAIEMNCVAAWIMATTTCYVAALLPVVLPLSILAAIPIAAILIHVPIVPGGALLRLMLGDGDHVKIVSVITMVLLLIASSYFATVATWPRFVACFFVAVFIVNSIAAVLLWLMRDRVRAAEERCVR